MIQRTRRHQDGDLRRGRMPGRWLALLALTLVMMPLTLPGLAAPSRQATPAATPAPDRAAAIMAIAEDAMTKYALNAVILKVTIDGEVVAAAALGESMTGVPATTDMHFRNGAVAISYVSTLLLVFVDQGLVSLDDPLSIWLPDLPDAERVTLRMLANMTAGYPDYVQNESLLAEFYADPFRQWTTDELIAFGLSTPRLIEPGTNWDYSHTNYVILGQALETIGGAPLNVLLQDNVLAPLGLANTTDPGAAAIPDPVLHAFTSERRVALGIAPGTRFYEESTFWNPSWTLAQGAIQTTNIHDMAATAVAIGEGTLLSPESHAAQTAPDLLGFDEPLEGCPNCHTLDEKYNYGLGVVRSGPWLMQNPLFAGYGAVEAYFPEERIAIAVAATYAEASFDDQGDYRFGFASQLIFEDVAELLAPGSIPPSRSTHE